MGESKDIDFSILFVEENPESFHQIKESLETNRRFPSRVDRAATLEEALEKLQKNSYHLLLVESELENQLWPKLLEGVHRYRLNLPFVLLAPTHDDELIREAMRQGVADLIVRNEFEFEDLAKKLRDSYKKFRSRSHASRTLTEDLSTTTTESRHGSIRDQLTGLFNHTYLQERVVQEFSRASRYNYPISCLAIDIDHFKTINEEKGYRIGDALLKECSDLLFENCRLSDLISRYGGEEFIVLLPHVNYEKTEEVAYRLRELFSEHLFLENSDRINLTVSIGISSFPEDTMKRRCELITYAVQALFRSKAAGRNRVTSYKDIVPIFGEGLPSLKISEDKVLEFQRRLSEISILARRAYIDSSKALIVALESKDPFTAGHGATCAKYAMQVAEAVGMSVDEAEIVEHAALLHDIGKICIPDNILLKTAKLTFAEYEAMKQHPYLGYQILKPIKFLQEEAILVLHHHEWFNGEGYPCRLSRNEIPLGARIISVIDSYDTIRIAGGRYKRTATVEDAVNELIACSGAQFDPEVVRAFVEVLKARGELRTDDYNKARLEEILRTCHVA